MKESFSTRRTVPQVDRLMATRQLRVFKRWMISQGIRWSSDALEFIHTPEQGISVKALRDLREGEVVATIPKSACLTIKNSGACDIIEAAGLGGCLGLSVALMYEKSLGNDSPWAAYFQLLPDRESLPLVWTLDEVDQLLFGTELHKVVKEDKALIYDDWKENILPLVDTGHFVPHFFGPENYFAARSLIASRSFEIDDYYGSGMVPLADLFNHKTGAEDVHFTSGSSDSKSDDDDKSNTNGCYTENTVDKEPSSALGCELDDPRLLEMIMVKDVKAGAEVFNTYGLVGNAALLHRYGFTEPDNPYDIVNIDLELVLKWSSSLFSGRYSRARLSLWRKSGYSGCVSQNAEYFEISCNGEPQIELLILLYIMLLQEDEYCKLDLAVSTANNYKESISMILSEKCNITWLKRSEANKGFLLTKSVCSALLWLADRRESFYGLSSMKDDIEAAKTCSKEERKLYHSLMLRLSERRILGKLRAYAAVATESLKNPKKASKRKRLKRT
ncbi:hypothetical protein JCGZ_25882 [Jatropha curcas]|uniref:N-lysine methyltransferase n=1 Tax=Jatropha curcas TaxID=180498 RepID=A0A067JW75_JATCU|nr:ribosomal lysine N-methyltransferase 3 [Jatropha curcas]XP_012088395.1 ribosomal lysine N-methyltransferase 3 [Jatropha curcas]XP_012088396.1 ribosomal lysine N-methyltransferase 3 [Jatropha curcas]KDP24225.1 hypothetical protein JCGZ_25882 [Jatropha curcas]